MSNILLIEPSVRTERYLVNKDLNPHGGLLQLGTILKKAGHKVHVVHGITDNLDSTLPQKLEGVDIAGITFTTFQLKQAKSLANLIRNLKPDVKIIAGGAHVSATNGLQDYFDVLIKGEADKTFLDVIENRIQYDHYVQGVPIENLDDLPYPDLSLVDIKKFSGIYPPGPLPQINCSFSRGCPYSCSFCSKSVFGSKVRFRNFQSVIDEIEQAYIDYGVKEAFFQDDTFNVNIEHAKELCEQILLNSLNKRMKFRARLRANEKLVDQELLDLMKRAGFWLIFYGVESGNQKILDDAIGKRLTIDEIKRAFKMTRDAGIATEASFIIGMPGETKQTVLDSVDLWRELKPDWCSFNRAIPFPGTRFYEEVKAKGHILYPDFEDYELNKTLVRTDALDGDELEKWAVECDNLILKEKIKRVLSHPSELRHVIKDSGLVGISKRLVSLAR